MKAILKKQFIFRTLRLASLAQGIVSYAALILTTSHKLFCGRNNKTAIAGIGLLSLLSPFQAFAFENIIPSPIDALYSIISFVGGLVIGKVIDALNSVLYFLISAFGYTITLTAYLAEVAINESMRSLSNMEIVKTGWMISRDFANIFFIFILLVIAIATILRIETYGAKRLLFTLIIVALFINFSLVLTQYIIQPANLLSFYLLDAAKNGQAHLADSVGKAFWLSSIFNTKEKKATLAGMQEMIDRFFKPKTSITAETLLGILLFVVLILYMMIAFAFISVAVLVTIRTVVLMMLMILAPLAFLFHALPATQGYARQWWNKLLSQTLFLPVMLFFIYLAVGISAQLPDFMGLTTAGKNPALDPEFLYVVVLVIIFFYASLIAAKQLGAVGAGAMMKWGGRLYAGAAGFVGALALRQAVARPAAALESRVGRETIAKMELKTGLPFARAMESVTRAGGTEKKAEEKIPLMQRLSAKEQADYFSKLSRLEQDVVGQQLGPQQLARMREEAGQLMPGQSVLSAQQQGQQAAIDRAVKGLLPDKQGQFWLSIPKDAGKNWDNLSPAVQDNIIRSAEREGMQDIINNLKNDAERQNFAQYAYTREPKKVNDILSVLPSFAKSVGKTTAQVIPKIDFGKIDPSQALPIIDEIARATKPEQLPKLIERNDALTKGYLAELQALYVVNGKDINKLTDQIAAWGNRELASKIRTNREMRVLLGLT